MADGPGLSVLLFPVQRVGRGKWVNFAVCKNSVLTHILYTGGSPFCFAIAHHVMGLLYEKSFCFSSTSNKQRASCIYNINRPLIFSSEGMHKVLAGRNRYLLGCYYLGGLASGLPERARGQAREKTSSLVSVPFLNLDYYNIFSIFSFVLEPD